MLHGDFMRHEVSRDCQNTITQPMKWKTGFYLIVLSIQAQVLKIKDQFDDSL